MVRTILFIALGIILFGLLYDVFKTKRYVKTDQIIAAIIGAFLLVYILYTCKSDN
jgi:uncharacterized membrane protein YeaQ/YmgE (transglycosylase-associated protein family)